MDELTGKLGEVLDKLVATVEAKSPIVWNVIVSQMRLEGIVRFVTGLVCLGIAIFLVKVANKNNREERSGWDHDDGPWVTCWIAIIVLGASAALFLTYGFLGIMNPEFYAIKMLLGTIK